MTDNIDPTLVENYQANKPESGKRGPKVGSTRRFDPEVAALRAAEIRRRNSTAIHRANKVLASQHRDEFATYVRLARAEVAAERGPLPGDTE